ncbi:MAG: RidA family protein [Acidobacteriia bacterium]|nr:RidA family protein [Terriglobia bacterium]
MKEVVQTTGAPKAIGPYSQAIRANGWVFASGQIALDPETQQPIEGDIAAQTERVFKNLEAVLKAAGTGLEKVVKTTVFLVDISEFAAMNEVYARFFKDNPPARSTVAVARLPRDRRVEIDVIALA